MAEKERNFIRNEDFEDYDDEEVVEVKIVAKNQTAEKSKKKESLRDRTYKNINYINNFSKLYLKITLVLAVVGVVVGFFAAIALENFLLFLYFVIIATVCYLNVFLITLFINWGSLLLENIAEINNKTK